MNRETATLSVVPFFWALSLLCHLSPLTQLAELVLGFFWGEGWNFPWLPTFHGGKAEHGSNTYKTSNLHTVFHLQHFASSVAPWDIFPLTWPWACSLTLPAFCLHLSLLAAILGNSHHAPEILCARVSISQGQDCVCFFCNPSVWECL